MCILHNYDWNFQHNKYFHKITCSIPFRILEWARMIHSGRGLQRRCFGKLILGSTSVLIELHSWTRNAAEKFMPHMMQNWRGLYVRVIGKWVKNKRPMGHIAHLRKQFKSINTYDYIKMLIKRRKKTINFMRIYWFFIWTNLNPLHPRMLCAKFGWNWPSGSGEEDF